MSLARFWSTFKLLKLSKPAANRPIYNAVRGKAVGSILEVNVGSGTRCEVLIPWLRQQAELETIRYAAVDEFETGGAGHVSLKEFHSRLGRLGTKPLPVPNTGNLSAALARVAHTIGAVDLAIFDCEAKCLSEPTVAAILPRLLKADTIILVRSQGSEMLATTSATELTKVAAISKAA